MEFNLKEIRSRFEYHEDGKLIWKISPASNIKVGDVAGSFCKRRGYFVIHINDKQYLLHRIIYFWHHGVLPELIDHKDRNPLNNKIDNLRSSDKTRNGLNRGANKNSKSGIKGVSFDVSRTKWKAQLKIGSKVYSKRFDSCDDAVAWLENLRKV